MYNLSNFEPYLLRKHLANLVVLVWSGKGGYQFMTVLDRAKAIANGLEFKIIGIESDEK